MIQRIKSRFSRAKEDPLCSNEVEAKAEPVATEPTVKRNAEGMIAIPVLMTGRRNYY